MATRDVVLTRIEEADFDATSLSLQDLMKAPNGSFQGRHVGKAEIYPSKKISNAELCIDDLILPHSIIENDKYCIGEYDSPALTLFRLDDCLISNIHGVILVPELEGFFGPSARFLNKRPMYTLPRPDENFIKLPKDVARKATKIKSALIFHSAAVNNYYHWHVETLPLLFSLRGQILSGDIVPIWAREPNRFQKATLAALGLSKAVKRVPSEILKVKRAYWGTSLRSFPLSRFSPVISETFDFMKASVLSKSNGVESDIPRRVQVIRKGVGRRPIVNENDLTAVLTAQGCAAVDPGDLSYEEQIQLFDRADVIVAQHGGALTNIGFCRPGAKVLEIVGETYVNPCFWGIGHICGVRYAATRATAVDRSNIRDKNSPATVDVETTLDVYKKLIALP